MKKFYLYTIMAASAITFIFPSRCDAQYRKMLKTEPDPEVSSMISRADTADVPLVLSLDDALKIALSENVSVKVADRDIVKAGYARQGTYASLFPQIDLTGNYQRTIKKQVMYMDIDMPEPNIPLPPGMEMPDMDNGLEVGRWNTWSAGVMATMPIINAQLWKSLRISGLDVDLAVEKARSSRLEMVTAVKNAYYAILLAQEAFDVFKSVYDNAVHNLEETQKKFNAEKASELDLIRAKTNVANAVPQVYDAESSVILAKWQLKAVIGMDLDADIDVSGSLLEYSEDMSYDLAWSDSVSLENNSTMRQLAIQAEQLAESIKLQKYAYIPSLGAAFSFNMNAMANDYKFSQYRWTPYSYVGISLTIPIFSGGKRYNNVRKTQVQYGQLELQTHDAERQIKIGIRQGLNTLETSMKTYFAADAAMQTAQKGYDIAEKAYQVGRSTLVELNDAQLALTQARLGVSQAIYKFIVAKAQLEQTLGVDFIDSGEFDPRNKK